MLAVTVTTVSGAPDPSPTHGARQDDPLVELIRREPGLAGRLLARHQPDERGHCSGCTLPQSGAQRWPCSIHGAARRAEQAGAR